MTIAVTGATGELGGRVARELSAGGVPQRLIVRDPARAPQLSGADVAVATYEDSEAMAKALRGVSTMLLVSAHEGPERISVHHKAIEGARLAGVERIVYTSIMGAAPNATFPYARDHFLTEQAIREAGIVITSMRNALYADLAPLFVGDDGVIRAPAGHGRVAWVARADVARLAHRRLDRDLPDARHRRGLGDQSHDRVPHRQAPHDPGRVPGRRASLLRPPDHLTRLPAP